MLKQLTGILLLLSTLSCTTGKHLFILSGQSNMVGLHPEESFIPTLEEALGPKKVIVVKDAMGSQPIRRWYKNWTPLTGDTPVAQPDLYDSLMTKVNAAIKGQKIATATFIWMQGERDAREGHANVYARSLRGLHQQVQTDLGLKSLNFIIGRLSDFDMNNEKYPDWTALREVQVQVGESDPRHFAWINTDDLNDGVNREGKTISNDLHMSAEGYKIMGERFARAAIRLIRGK